MNLPAVVTPRPAANSGNGRFQQRSKRRGVTACTVALLLTSFSIASAADEKPYTPGQGVAEDFEDYAKVFLQKHCMDCHGETDPAGAFSMHDLRPVDEISAGIWRSIWAQVTLKEMPPADADQPDVIERLRFSEWIVGELTRALSDKGGFRDHLDPNKGNYVDHDLLFGPLPDGIKLAPTSTP
ncbi:MAG: hypothetical protein KDA81_21630, partial [Planctomycetaceae bacterium]|nr:hypothetical protein [Planctomycetaceae bacterium]